MRTRKPRKCSIKTRAAMYKPAGIPAGELEKVSVMREELEALRLCDSLGLTQEQAGRRMGVSRGTVQRILSSARKKTADALSGCKAIVITNETPCD